MVPAVMPVTETIATATASTPKCCAVVLVLATAGISTHTTPAIAIARPATVRGAGRSPKMKSIASTVTIGCMLPISDITPAGMPCPTVQ